MERNCHFNSWQKAIALLLSIVLFSMPMLLIARQSEIDQARIEAERDARKDTNGALWFFAGCCGGPVGLVVSYAITPSPPASRLLGKSPEYVAYYTDFYRAKAKNIQTSRALMGCGVTVAVYIASYIWLLWETGGLSD
ncbi:hypothetical protein FJZ31_39145 [Candidatus Poribacteria bacterium]|nr:hypothetical protein [Candidatus Poribacteria bacterium]